MARACACGVVGCKRHGRKSATRKGWGSDHQHRRAEMLKGMEQGRIPAICARCGGGPRYGDPWEAGHVVPVALGGGPQIRPEHRSCNRRAGAQLRTALKKRQIEARAQARIAATERAFFPDNERRRPFSGDPVTIPPHAR